MTLKELAIGKSAVIRTVGASGALRQHFLDMGMIPGAEVTVVKFAPMGDPMELQVHGYELTLRLAEAEQIEVEEISERTNSHSRGERLKPVDHPGIGEEGKYHSEEDANPLPDGTVLTYALVGNQNCGKTTLFNQLTGANQHVGNFPGVTVDRKDGTIKGYPNTNVTDLPGIYSMSPYSSEERPHLIIRIMIPMPNRLEGLAREIITSFVWSPRRLHRIIRLKPGTRRTAQVLLQAEVRPAIHPSNR